MKMKTLIAVAVAGAFAVPFAAQASADGDRMIVAQASGGAAGGAQGGAAGGAPGGAAAGAQGGAATGAQGSAASGASQGQGGQAGGGSGPRPTTQQDMGSLDKNSDGYVSREEASGHESLNTRFSELDKDSDGRISREEWNAGTGSAATGATTGTTGSTSGSTTGAPADPAKARGENPGVTR